MLDRFVGISYKELNCYDLVREIYSLYGIYLPEQMFLISDYFVPVSSIMPFDLIAFQVVPIFTSHIGIYIGRDKFLHSTPINGVICERLSQWKHKQRGVYRYE